MPKRVCPIGRNLSVVWGVITARCGNVPGEIGFNLCDSKLNEISKHIDDDDTFIVEK